MNPEQVCKAIHDTLREYVSTRSAYKKDGQGQTWSTGMTVVSPDDKRLEEIARMATEAVLRCSDKRPRQMVECRSLQLGDVFTRYSIKEGIAIDEEVTVLKASTVVNRTTIKYRRPDGSVVEIPIEASYLVAVVRPSKDDLRQMLVEDSNG